MNFEERIPPTPDFPISNEKRDFTSSVGGGMYAHLGIEENRKVGVDRRYKPWYIWPI